MAGGGLCPALGTFLTVAAVILLIFVNIGQVNVTQVVPRHIRMVDFTTYGVGAAVASATGGTDNNTAIYGDVNQARGSDEVGSGLRTVYAWGLWTQCAGYGGPNNLQYCTGSSFAKKFKPVETILHDVPQDESQALVSVLPADTFTDDGYLGKFSSAAFYFIFIGTIVAGLTMFVGLVAHRFAFLCGAAFAVVSFLLVGIGAAIWTAIIYRARRSINGATLPNGTPVGINIDYGNALWMTWGATGALFLAIVPFLLGCCTGRGRSSTKDEYY